MGIWDWANHGRLFSEFWLVFLPVKVSGSSKRSFSGGINLSTSSVQASKNIRTGRLMTLMRQAGNPVQHDSFASFSSKF